MIKCQWEMVAAKTGDDSKQQLTTGVASNSEKPEAQIRAMVMLLGVGSSGGRL